jgi:large subunit ribosomal protein L30
MSKEIKIKLMRSYIGRPKKHRLTLQALGLTRLNKVVTHTDTPQIRGMINQVCHLVEVIE